MSGAVLYVHGKGGSADEADHYSPLFPDRFVTGLDYRTFTPWETGKEIKGAVERLRSLYGDVIITANSIGAFFTMNAGVDGLISRAYFISPIVDMEKLIRGMMAASGVTDAELEKQGVIPTAFGEDLSWEYLTYVRDHPLSWKTDTRILYGALDALTDRGTVADFAQKHGARLTVMENGEHWFHTDEQMRFLDDWIIKERTI